MIVEPRNDFVFVREVAEIASPGGIIFAKARRPWSAKDGEHREGIVLAVGPGKLDRKGRRESMWGLEVGQRIAFSPNGNWKQRVGDEELIVIRRDSVIGLVEGDRAAA